MIPVQFQGRVSSGKISSVLMLASALALPGCAPKASLKPSAIPVVAPVTADISVDVSNQPVEIADFNTVQVVEVGGRKLLWVNGFRHSLLVPFCRQEKGSTGSIDVVSTGVVQDQAWRGLGGSDEVKTIEVDGEEFAVLHGKKRVAVSRMETVCPEDWARLLADPANESALRALLKEPAVKRQLRELLEAPSKSLDKRTPVQFQGRFSPKNMATTLMLASALALPGCGPKAPLKPPVAVDVSNKPVRISYANTVQVVWIEGQKFLKVDGFRQSFLVPFCKQEKTPTSVIRDQDWREVGKLVEAKTIRVDGEEFVLFYGHMEGAIERMEKHCPQEWGRALENPATRLEIQRLLKDPKIKERLQQLLTDKRGS